VHTYQERAGILVRLLGSAAWRIGASERVASPALLGLRRKISELHSAGLADIVEMEETWGHARHLIGNVPVPVVVRLHGPWFLNGRANGADLGEGRNYRLRVKLEGKAIAAADAVTAPSKSVLTDTRNHYGASLAEAAAIPNPMEFRTEAELWSDEDCEKNTILFVGRFDRHKGGDVVIRAFRKVAKRHVGARLLFCGPDRGFTDDEGRTYSMEEYVNHLSLPRDIRSRIEVLGQQPPCRIEALRRLAAVTVVASRYENFGGVLLEAASYGCPLVATHCGGTPEIVENGETGLLVPPGDADELANAILRLLADRALAAQIGRQAWVRGRHRFSPEALAVRTLRFFGHVIEHRHGRRKLSRAMRR
jgi:glycosyltransferase involved in cell wall biosynthesis